MGMANLCGFSGLHGSEWVEWFTGKTSHFPASLIFFTKRQPHIFLLF